MADLTNDTLCALCGESISSWRHHNGPCLEQAPHDHSICHSFREPTVATFDVTQTMLQQAVEKVASFVPGFDKRERFKLCAAIFQAVGLTVEGW